MLNFLDRWLFHLLIIMRKTCALDADASSRSKINFSKQQKNCNEHHLIRQSFNRRHRVSVVLIEHCIFCIIHSTWASSTCNFALFCLFLRAIASCTNPTDNRFYWYVHVVYVCFCMYKLFTLLFYLYDIQRIMWQVKLFHGYKLD